MAVLVRLYLGSASPETGADGSESFDGLYRRWRGDVVALCRKLLIEQSDAEDAAQEAFLRAWLARDRYSPARPFWPWLSTIARRVCVDRRRRSMREEARQAALASDGEPLERPLEHVFELGEDLKLVFRAIDGLRPAERRALVLREIYGWSYQQIATVEGVTVDAIRGSLKRARASLRRSAGYAGVLDGA
jgi:RNA polymerase sigma-70 factor (ECF subfamily)